MSAGRPLWRPSIRDLQRYLFSPRIQPPTRCISHLTCQSELTKASVIWQSQRKPNRPFSTSSTRFSSPKPKSHDRGPPSAEDTQTDFGALNVLGSTPIPSTSIDACLWDGFHLNSGVKITGGAGVLLVAGEAFSWRPWEARKGDLRLVNNKGQWDVEDGAWGLFELLWPKPGHADFWTPCEDLLILGLGKEMRPISPRTRQYINSLGIRVDIQDTRNAAAQFNLLATERGVGSVAAALIPLGWKEGVGVK